MKSYLQLVSLKKMASGLQNEVFGSASASKFGRPFAFHGILESLKFPGSSSVESLSITSLWHRHGQGPSDIRRLFGFTSVSSSKDFLSLPLAHWTSHVFSWWPQWLSCLQFAPCRGKCKTNTNLPSQSDRSVRLTVNYRFHGQWMRSGMSHVRWRLFILRFLSISKQRNGWKMLQRAEFIEIIRQKRNNQCSTSKGKGTNKVGFSKST